MSNEEKEEQKLPGELALPPPDAAVELPGELALPPPDAPIGLGWDKERWDRYYAVTSCHFLSESYADWPQLQTMISSHISSFPPPASILVPACGTSRLSENLYDAGFTNITNVDFSKVLIAHMLRRNVRDRPLMKWRVADMTKMDQLACETFDAVIDKGAWDGLVDPNHVSPYFVEIKRLLKTGGRYICFTFGESSMALYVKFRFGWKVSLYAIDLKQSEKPHQQAFMLVMEKLDSTIVSQITLDILGRYNPECHGDKDQARKFLGPLENELKVREEYSTYDASKVFVPYEDLVLVAKVNFKEFQPGRRLQLTIGEFGVSRFFYDCVLIDGHFDAGPFSDLYCVKIVPMSKTLEWVLQESETQWVTVKTHGAARLLMLTLDTRHADMNEGDVLIDITPLIQKLAPDCGAGTCEIEIVFTSDGLKNQKSLGQITSSLSGLIEVDDVIYNEDCFPAKYLSRRLNIQKYFISEVLYTIDKPVGVSATSKMKKKGKQGEPQDEEIRFDHSYLASPHHNAIISGLLLIYVHLETTLTGLLRSLVVDSAPPSEVKTVIIGLRAGVLPMFMNTCLPFLTVEVVEKDPLIHAISKDYFGFREDERLKVHLSDGFDYITEKDIICSDGGGSSSTSKIDILIVDVEVPHSKSDRGFTAPDVSLIEESFLLSVKKVLSKKGLFIVNIIAWSSFARDSIYAVLKSVFPKVFYFQVTPGVNEVIFALPSESPIDDSDLSEACDDLERALRRRAGEWAERVIDASKLIKTLE